MNVTVACPLPAVAVTPVGADGAVHGYEALYVADASIFPSSIGVNPMLTVIAMATNVARALAARAAEGLASSATRLAAAGRPLP